MKVSVQSKIAELEQRLAAVEKALATSGQMHKTYVVQTQSGLTQGGLFGTHWDRMWDEFSQVMKHAFGGK